MTLLLAALLALPAAAEDWNARITEVSGTVLIYSQGSEEGLPAEAQTPLEDGDRVETGDDGRAELALEADSVVELGAGTSFTVGSTQKADSWFSLDVGSLVAKLKSFQSRRAALRVRTPTAVAAVRGTEFGVEVGDDGETSVGVYDEGRVAVTAGGEDGGEETMLTAKQETTLAPGQREFKVRRLERLEHRRERMTRLRARRDELRKGWKDFTPEKRRELRQNWRAGMREKLKNMPPEQRRKLLQRFSERRRKLDQRRGGDKKMRPGNGPGGPGKGRGPGGPRREIRKGGGGRRR